MACSLVSSGSRRRSTSISHSAGTTLTCVPPRIVPMQMVGEPRRGCRFFANAPASGPLIRSITRAIAEMAFTPLPGAELCAATPCV